MKNYAKDGEVMYHTGLCREMIDHARIAVVPGDPGRVDGLARFFDMEARFLTSHRDYTSWLAHVNGMPVLVMSTGMGGPCVTFAVEEMARLGVETFIRVGTTGSIQESIHLGDVIINKASVRMDGASKNYAPVEYPGIADLETTMELKQAAAELGISCHMGISVSTDSFWPGQERYDSFGGYVLRRLQGSMDEFRHLGCTNYEMENATLFTVTSVLGLKASSICGVVAQRTSGEAVASRDVYLQAEEKFRKIVRKMLENRSNAGENRLEGAD